MAQSYADEYLCLYAEHLQREQAVRDQKKSLKNRVEAQLKTADDELAHTLADFVIRGHAEIDICELSVSVWLDEMDLPE